MKINSLLLLKAKDIKHYAKKRALARPDNYFTMKNKALEASKAALK